MKISIKEFLAGSSLLLVSGFFARETVIFAWGKFLDYILKSNLFFNGLNELDILKTIALLMLISGILLIVLSLKKDNTSDELFEEANYRESSIKHLRIKFPYLTARTFQQDILDEFYKSQSFLDLMKKKGFKVPNLNEDAFASLIIVLAYIQRIKPYLTKGLLSNGKKLSKAASDAARQSALNFQESNWFVE